MGEGVTAETFPKTIARQQIIDALAVLGISAYDVYRLTIARGEIDIETPYHDVDGETKRTQVSIPVVG